MAYSELIKNFEKIRGYMREFYVYGFKSREEYDAKSARSYDNERRRMGSWLGDYMSFPQDQNGKNVFISVDNRNVPHNPLFSAYKAKSFTDNDIILHFYILDLLAGGCTLTVKQITERIGSDYLSHFESADVLDESTVRKKLKEYEQLGLLESEKVGRELAFRRAKDEVDLDSWRDAIDFFSETDPLGVVGSYLLDRFQDSSSHFSFKHHYLLFAMDSEVIYDLLTAIRERRSVELTSYVVRRGELRKNTVLPMKIYISTQSGRHYLLGYHYRLRRPMFFRMDNIRKVKPGAIEARWEKYAGFFEKFRENLWGVSLGSDHSLDHIEITIHVSRNEGYILDRLEREKRCGRIEPAGDFNYRYIADVYDSSEMLPWIRTFIGRIVSLECSNEHTKKRFYEDLETMRAFYGGESNAVQ